ncbi:hypothetical protein Gotri_022657 [Gossypium trilobum]|uniref:DUF4283 domain-containing protein n=1 Tax=Gossypium trilobum TaxID=34281 RepID=A0A7J9DGF8_9ROSI|nr:hypothetical protein [Gossypium trilobum]
MDKDDPTNKLMGSQNSTDPFQALEDIEVQEGDVKTKVISGIPSIVFSERVHKFIEKKMAKTVFNDEEDFKNVLTKGPWVIFGQYLTVRPWLPNFSMAQDEVESQVVWVWLHGLSKWYYSTSILQAIHQAIGPMVKTDDNMENASRGRFDLQRRATGSGCLLNADSGEMEGKQMLIEAKIKENLLVDLGLMC